jgi:hypothetical protein
LSLTIAVGEFIDFEFYKKVSSTLHDHSALVCFNVLTRLAHRDTSKSLRFSAMAPPKAPNPSKRQAPDNNESTVKKAQVEADEESFAE